jgi:hypothetical protein
VGTGVLGSIAGEERACVEERSGEEDVRQGGGKREKGTGRECESYVIILL